MLATVRRLLPGGVLAALLAIGVASAGGLADLSNQDAAQGIKGALNTGIATAVGKLGVPGGFLNNPKVRIPLPPALEKAAGALRLMGRGKDADELEQTMNKAAERAVPQARPLLVGAVKSMTLVDAKNILAGGDNSVTQFFRSRTSNSLTAKFMPLVKQQTDRLGLARQYNQLAGEGVKLGLINGDAANIEQYVTAKALEGLYAMIGDEERAIREHPAQAGSAIVSKVFSALK